MLTKHTPLRLSLIASSLVFVAMGIIFLFIDSLTSGLIEDPEKLKHFRLQLLIVALFVSVIFYMGTFFYQNKQARRQQNLNLDTQATQNNKTETTLSAIDQTEVTHLSTYSPEIDPLTIKEAKASQALTNLLIVDDNPANILIMEELLKSNQVHIQSTHDGNKAIQLYQQQAFDIIFMDIEMTGIDGFKTTEAIRLLQKDQKRIPIVAVSAHSEHDKRSEALIGGFDDYIVKPVTQRHLRDALNRWTHQQTQQVALTESNQPVRVPNTVKAINKAALNNSHEEATIDKVVNIETSLEFSHQNKQLAKDMLTLLITMVREEVDTISDLHQQQDWEELYHVVHKLYGGCCYCGVPQLQKVSQQVENLLQKKTYDDIDEPIKELLKAMNDLITWDEQFDAAIVFGIDED